MQTVNPPLRPRAPRLYTLANPYLLLRQQLIRARINHRLLRQLLLLLLLVQSKVARKAQQLAAVKLHNARSHCIQKSAVVANRHHAALKRLEQFLQPNNRIHIQMVSRLIQQQYIRLRD